MANDSEEKQPPVPPRENAPGATPPASQAEEKAKPSEPTAAQPPAPPAAKPAVPPAAKSPASPAGAVAKPPAAAGAAKPPAAAAPRPPAAPPAPKEGPVALDNDLVKRYKARFGAAIREAWTDRKQAILVVDNASLLDIALYSRDEEKFDWLSDLTAVDWPKREKRFDIVLTMYSFPKNERLRLKVHAADGERVPSVHRVWSTSNWMEREVYDMFGVIFEGHPDLKRLLLPEEWQGFPLRKDYDILTQDTDWVRENLGIESGQ